MSSVRWTFGVSIGDEESKDDKFKRVDQGVTARVAELLDSTSDKIKG